MDELVVIGFARTPFGVFLGGLSTVPAPRLGSLVISEVVKRTNLKPGDVSEVIMGNVITAGEGQAPARQAALGAGLPASVPAVTINKVCGSGMKAVMLGAQSLLLGDSGIVIAGGMENMSMAPYGLPGARHGLRMGDRAVVDLMITDGLWDPYHDRHMGNFGDLCAAEKGISREELDEYALGSFERATRAWAEGNFDDEIVPVRVKEGKRSVAVTKDEGPEKAIPEKIPRLKPVFHRRGTVTAANASGINDGAAALALTTSARAKKIRCKPLARIVSYATHAQEPEWFTTAPVGAIKKALKKAGWKIKQVDLFEVNEAFAAVPLAAMRALNIPHDKMNVWGGAIAIGHPIGASGARIVLTLINALRSRGLAKGVAAICIGGGEATAMCVEIV